MNELKVSRKLHQVELTVTPKVSLFARIILLLITIPSLSLIPLLIYQVATDESFQSVKMFAAFLTLLLMCGFFGRLVLWNFFGEEKIIVKPRELEYQYSYGLFKSKPVTKVFNTVKPTYTKYQEMKKNSYSGKFFFEFDNGNFESALKLPLEEVELRAEQLNQFLNPD